VQQAVSQIAVAIPTFHFDMLFTGLGNLAPLLATAIPLGVYNFAEAMSNVESAAAAGDSYNLRSVLLADGSGAIIGAALGSPFPPAVYIGHPGWKATGGRTSYSMGSGIFIAVLCFLGLFGVLTTLLPIPAIVPILLYIGLLIGAQAFQATPKLHAAAVVAAIIPNIASWGAGLIDNALAAAGTTAAKLGEGPLTNAGLVYHGLHVLGQGAVLAGIVLGAIVTFILERQLVKAAIFAGAGAALSWIGLLHADAVKWGAAPQVALGYLLLALVLLGIGAVQRRSAPAQPALDEGAMTVAE
jgi:AGZA family xanthine/uracil permease-like MFS transporter